MQKILLVDDDERLRKLIKTYAEVEGFLCVEAENGEKALTKAQAEEFDLCVLDVMMPEMDGFSMLAELRKFSSMPVILLTARTEEYDKLHGFNLGADDYVAKPFSPKELVARIKAVTKRTGGGAEGKPLCFGSLTISEPGRTVMVEGKEIGLTPKEYDLLLYMAKNNMLALSREQLLNKVWGYDYFGDGRTVDTHIKSLRERLGSSRSLITTIWGVGYRFAYKETAETMPLARQEEGV